MLIRDEICIVCLGPKPDAMAGNMAPYHTKCSICPKCNSDFTVLGHNTKPVVLRCMNCLNRWEGKQVIEICPVCGKVDGGHHFQCPKAEPLVLSK